MQRNALFILMELDRIAYAPYPQYRARNGHSSYGQLPSPLLILQGVMHSFM